MIMIERATLENVVNEVLDGRSPTEFDTFEQFWDELDALFWYDAQDTGEDCRGQQDEIRSIFNELAAAS